MQHLANAGSGKNKSMIAYILANGEPCNAPYNKYWGWDYILFRSHRWVHENQVVPIFSKPGPFLLLKASTKRQGVNVSLLHNNKYLRNAHNHVCWHVDFVWTTTLLQTSGFKLTCRQVVAYSATLTTCDPFYADHPLDKSLLSPGYHDYKIISWYTEGCPPI